MFSGNFIRRWMLQVGTLVIALLASRSQAQFTVNIDEQGNGSIMNAAGGTQPLPSLGNIVDPLDPTSGLHPLAYAFNPIAGAIPTPGDILVLEPPNSTTGGISDILRFEHGLLLVYSEKTEVGEPPQLADVGIPTQFQPNAIREFETGPEPGLNGLFGFTPVAGDPGSMSIPITYNFTSDPAVPEPGALALVPFAGLALLRRRRPIV